MRLLTVTLVLAILMVTAREILVNHSVPNPVAYLHVMIVWGALGLVNDLSRGGFSLGDVGMGDIAGVFSIGILLAMAYTYFSSGSPFLGGTELNVQPDTGVA